MEIPSWFFGDKIQMIVAGAVGGMVRWITLRADVRDGLASIVVGSACAMYLGPVCLPILEPIVGKLIIDPASRAGLSGFLIGVGGIGVSGFVIDAWRARSLLGAQNRSGGDSP